MSTRYKSPEDVPSAELCARLKELSKIIPEGREVMRDEFTMRIPAEVDRDADIVISEAANRIAKLEAENARLRSREEWIWGNCKVVYFAANGAYPIEHNPHAGKDGRFFLEPIITSALNHSGDANKMVADLVVLLCVRLLIR